MEKTLNKQVSELLARVENIIVTAIQDGATTERISSGAVKIDDLKVYEGYDKKIFLCIYFNNPLITGLFSPTIEQLKARQKELYEQIKDINIQIAEREEQ